MLPPPSLPPRQLLLLLPLLLLLLLLLVPAPAVDLPVRSAVPGERVQHGDDDRGATPPGRHASTPQNEGPRAGAAPHAPFGSTVASRRSPA